MQLRKQPANRTLPLRFPVLIFALMLFPLLIAGAQKANAENIVFPAGAGVIDVTRPPYSAKGDGKTDDTAALQRALNDHTGSRHALYLPNGTYLLSRTLTLPVRNPQGNISYGLTNIQGQSREGVVLLLAESTFTDPTRPAAMLDSGPHGSADWFANSVNNLTLDTGRGNPGAIGLRFFSNNTGCVRDVTLRSGDGKGVCGLDLGYNDMNGPLLVKNVLVQGFAVGVQCSTTVNSLTFMHLRLENQSVCGFRNDGQCVSIEDLVSLNPSAPAVINRSGLMALVGAKLTGGSQTNLPAILNSADLYARNVQVKGYRQSIDAKGGANSNSALTEFVSSPAITLFPAPARALGLPIRETPEVPWDDPALWASPFGKDMQPAEGFDISDGLQKAIDSGATTVYIPTGAWRISKTIIVRGKVRRIIGMYSYLIPEDPVNSQDAPFFQIEEGTAKVVVMERVSFGFGWKKVYGIQNNTSRTLVLKDMELYAYRNRSGAGPLFVENVVGGPFTFTQQQVWARQLNQESEGTHITNAGGSLWVLGLKTERGGTLIDTKAGGSTEVLGGLCYTTTAGKLAPMFVNTDSSVSVTLGERCYSGDPYIAILSETRRGETKTLPNTAREYGGRLVLYAGKSPSQKRR